MTNEHQWQPPIPFAQPKSPTLEIESVLEGKLCEFVKALSVAVEVPIELPLMSVLGVISACSAKRFFVSPKEGWHEPVNLYSIVALPPGNNKSLVLRECVAPLVEWERVEQERVQKERIKQQSLRKSQEELIQNKRKKLSKLEGAALDEAYAEIAEMEENLQTVTPLPQLFANDATPESLSQAVADQEGRFAIFSDEAGIISTLGGLYTGGAANVDILLKGLDGGHVRVRRREHSYNLNPYLTLFLAIQPAILKQMAGKSAFQGNGVLERFLYLMPASTLGYRSHQTEPVSEGLKHYYQQFIGQLLNQFYSDEELKVLQLSQEAKQLWQQFQNTIETELRHKGKLYHYSGWGGKICGYALRIAGLLHIVQEEPHEVIMPETMQRALNLANHLIEHLCIVFPYMGIGDALRADIHAEALWEWLEKQNQARFSKTEITSGLRQQIIGRSENLKPALQQLIERNYLMIETDHSSKKPTTYYQLNPLAISKREPLVPCYS